MLENFITWMRVQKNYANNTITNYTRTMEQFDNFLKENTEDVSLETPEKITQHLINCFALQENHSGNKEKTTNNKLAGIKVFLRYCMIE